MELEIKGIGKKYHKKRVLSDINQHFEKGVYGLLGANGAGKTTLLNIIATAIPTNEGMICYDGNDIKKNIEAYRSIIGYLPQKIDFYQHFTAYDFLKYMYLLKGGKDKHPKQIEQLLRRLRLYDVRNNRIGTFSGGMKQRVGIIQAFLGAPQLVLLDEPTVGLDLEERAEFKRMVRELGETAIVILSTHIVSDVEETADYILFMDEGSVVEGNSRSYYEQRMQERQMAGLEEYYLNLAGRKLYDAIDSI